MLLRLTLRAATGPGLAALLLLAGAAALAQVATLLLRSSVLPDPGALALAVLALLPSLLSMVLPIALLLGLMLGYGRWSSEGTWIALRASGLPARRLLAPALLLGLTTALLMAGLTHLAAPAGKRTAARAMMQAASQVRLVPGHFVAVGDGVLHRTTGGSIFAARGDVALQARGGSLRSDGQGLLLELGSGRLLSEELALAFDSAIMPMELPANERRVELEERDSPSLWRLVERQRTRGRDASYANTILLKRTTLPLAAALLPILALPLGLRWGGRPWHAMGVVAAYWALVRLGDQLSAALGPQLAASLPLLGLLLAATALWASWTDR